MNIEDYTDVVLDSNLFLLYQTFRNDVHFSDFYYIWLFHVVMLIKRNKKKKKYLATCGAFTSGQYIFVSVLIYLVSRSAQPHALLLYVLSAVYSCRLEKIKNAVQLRVHDHLSYSGKGLVYEFHFVYLCIIILESSIAYHVSIFSLKNLTKRNFFAAHLHFDVEQAK